MSELTAFIDLYCERTAHGFFNEPLNAVSNASFIAAAWWASRQNVMGTKTPRVFWVLCVLAALIGFGSIAFHTVPSRFTQWLDVIPIWAFVVTYAMAVTHSGTGNRWRYTLSICAFVIGLVFVLFFVTGDNLSASPPGAEVRPYNGSLQYLPVVLVLLLFSVCAGVVNHRIKYHLWLATGLFVAALTFRTIDINVCSAFPVGTHFVWHLLDGVLIAVLLHGLYLQFRAQPR